MASRLGGGSYATDISPLFERNQEATVYVGNLDTRVDEDILWELFLQCGPIKNVHIPRDKITGMHQGMRMLVSKGPAWLV